MKEDREIKKSFVDIVREEEEGWIRKTNAKEKKDNGNGGGRKEIRMEVVEELEREKRRGNIVLMGVPEEGDEGEGEE